MSHLLPYELIVHKVYCNIGKNTPTKSPVIVVFGIYLYCLCYTMITNIESAVPFCVILLPEPGLSEPLMSLCIHEASDGRSLAASRLRLWWKQNQRQRAYIDFFCCFFSFDLFSVFTSTDYDIHCFFFFLLLTYFF